MQPMCANQLFVQKLYGGVVYNNDIIMSCIENGIDLIKQKKHNKYLTSEMVRNTVLNKQT